MGKRHLLLGAKLTHIRNKDVGLDGLQSALEQCSDLKEFRKLLAGL